MQCFCYLDRRAERGTRLSNTLRGLHGDKKTWKLVSCVFGKVFLVVVNYDKKSKNYLKVKKILLEDKISDFSNLHIINSISNEIKIVKNKLNDISNNFKIMLFK